MKVLMRYIACFLVCSLLSVSWAGTPEEDYFTVYAAISEAELLEQNGQLRPAYDKYLEAETGLKRLQTAHPTWNNETVKFRLNYLNEKVQGIQTKAGGKLPSAPQVAQEPAPKPFVPAPSEPGSDRIKALEAENASLQAKLREAFSVQTARTKTPAMEKAEARILELQKERDVLRTSLDVLKSKPVVTEDSKRVSQLEREVKEMRSDRDQALEKAAQLRKESENKGKKSDSKIAVEAAADAKTAAKLQEKLEKKESELASATEKFEKQLKDAQKERDALKLSVEELKKNPGSGPKISSETAADLKAAAKLQEKLDKKERELAGATEKFEKQLKEFNQQLKAKEEERAEAQKQNGKLNSRLASLEKDLEKAKTRKPAPKTEAKELELLKARIAVYEAKNVPFTAEELALMKAPSPTVRTADTAEIAIETGGKKAVEPKADSKPLVKQGARSLPVGSGPLVAEAERAFAARRYEEAEKKYLQVLSQDEGNVYILANLAAIQLEMGRLEESEKNVKKALQKEPEDSYSLTLLGMLKFRQNKFDDALRFLSQSAALNPDHAETQNYLGITLSQKGQRAAAEVALRKALLIQPTYANAHHNLAIIYATQKPPFLELARFHYQKSLSLGQPKNPEFEKILQGN